ncbi:unnamed protein product [Dicrocoelium dendriticum]|nr:unnamed protein product [Dicrocoelium dendriticum]
MYRSRMPYTRWHAKGELLKERMKQCTFYRYYCLKKDLSGSDDSVPSESEKLPALMTKSTGEAAGTDTQCLKASKQKHGTFGKAIREQQKECEKMSRILGFGTRCERFPERQMGDAPPPGTYSSKLSAVDLCKKSDKRSEEPFTKASSTNRSLISTGNILGPGVYDAQKVLNRSTVVPSFGRFDTSSELRCAQPKIGYLANKIRTTTGPRFTEFPTGLELLESKENRFKGKFSSIPRFPKQVPVNSVAPNSYSPININFRKESFNVKRVPFLKSGGRLTKKQYDAFIGNF